MHSTISINVKPFLLRLRFASVSLRVFVRGAFMTSGHHVCLKFSRLYFLTEFFSKKHFKHRITVKSFKTKYHCAQITNTWSDLSEISYNTNCLFQNIATIASEIKKFDPPLETCIACRLHKTYKNRQNSYILLYSHPQTRCCRSPPSKRVEKYRIVITLLW